jgi:hypothetical protein
MKGCEENDARKGSRGKAAGTVNVSDVKAK